MTLSYCRHRQHHHAPFALFSVGGVPPRNSACARLNGDALLRVRCCCHVVLLFIAPRVYPSLTLCPAPFPPATPKKHRCSEAGVPPFGRLPNRCCRVASYYMPSSVVGRLRSDGDGAAAGAAWAGGPAAACPSRSTRWPRENRWRHVPRESAAARPSPIDEAAAGESPAARPSVRRGQALPKARGLDKDGRHSGGRTARNTSLPNNEAAAGTSPLNGEAAAGGSPATRPSPADEARPGAAQGTRIDSSTPPPTTRRLREDRQRHVPPGRRGQAPPRREDRQQHVPAGPGARMVRRRQTTEGARRPTCCRRLPSYTCAARTRALVGQGY